MAVHSFRCQRVVVLLFVSCLFFFRDALAFSSSLYQLDSDYSGANFFEGWDFFTDGDPTGGFVSYYSQEAAELKGMINASDTAPVYIGSDYTTTIPLTARAGRPSVRISTQRNWTHGLFIGDFNHAPGGVCGTWPAFWTLGPNWPHNGEIDIMEGVNLLQYDASTLHAAPNCTIAGDPRYMTGQLSSTNDCAYYPDDNIGCGVTSKSNTSYGAGFNAVGGGIYAMQWTTEYIRVWIFMRDSIPSDITNKTPNPSSWGLPMANLQGDCIIDQRFQAHGIVLNNAFCGEYAGAPGVWDGSPTHCAAITNYTSCSAFVAAEPEAFQDAYWSINSVRVYQLVDPDNPTANGAPYIASEQPPQSTAPTTASTPVNPTTSLCPTYNFTVIQSGAYKYEIECGYDVGGFDLGPPTSTYSYTNFEGCVGGCSLWNQNNGSSTCAGVTYSIGNNACYWKSYIYSNPARDNFASARMLYYAYPVVADDPRSQTTSSSTGVYVQTLATPNYYVVSNATSTTTLSLISQTPIGNVTNGPGMGGGGVASTTAGSTTVSTANTVTSSQTFGSTTTSESFSDISTTSTTLMLSSSMSSYMTTEVTTESSTSPPASEPSSTLTTSMMTTSAQLSSRDVSFSTSSTTDVSQTTSSTLNPSSNPVSTSAQMTGSPSSVGSPTSAGSSSPTSHVQSSTTALTVTTSQTLTQPSGSMSTTSPTSSLAMSVSSVVSSIMPPPPSSSTTDEEPTSTSPTTEVTSTAATPPSSSEPSSLYTSPPPESSLPISQFVSPFQQPDTTSNAPPVFSTTAVSPESSTSGSYGGGDGVISTSFAAAPSPSTTTIEPSTPAASSTTSSGVLPGPTELTAPNGAQFSFAGCLGPKPNTPFANSFILTEDSPAMSIERCVLDCSAGVYAGLYDTQCYCSTYSLPIDMSADLTEYPVSACNTTCPADPTEKCGGKVSTSSSPSRFLRRQITNANGDTILLTLYNNTAAAEIGGSSTSAMMTTSSGAMTGGPGLGSMTSSNVNGGGSASFSTPAPPLVSSTTGAGAPAGSTSFSGANTDDANLGSMSTTSTIAGTFPSSTSGVDVSAILTSFPSSSSSSLSSSSLSPIVISTTYTTICALDPIICPTRTETCLATTVTVLHCGCTDTPVPEVPMTTTVVEACPTAPAQHAQAGGAAGGNNVGNGQEGNAAPMTTLTVPCASAISSLEASVTSWSASASAQASAAAHAEAAAGAAHPNVPYTSAVETQTLNLVIATAPFNFSVPSVPAPSNGSWVGEVKNMTIVPVALTAMAGAAGSAVAGASAAASAMAGFKSEGSCVRGWSGERGALLVGFALLLGVMGLGL